MGKEYYVNGSVENWKLLIYGLFYGLGKGGGLQNWISKRLIIFYVI